MLSYIHSQVGKTLAFFNFANRHIYEQSQRLLHMLTVFGLVSRCITPIRLDDTSELLWVAFNGQLGASHLQALPLVLCKEVSLRVGRQERYWLNTLVAIKQLIVVSCCLCHR